jgi:protein-S-isoprenylcysteine O-methyltransferase Ste14
MQDEFVFRAITISLFFSIIGVSAYFRSRANRLGGELQDKSSLRLVLLLRLLSLLVLLPLFAYMINPSWLAWAQLALPLWLRWLGVAGAAICLPLAIWILRSIGQNISPSHATRQNHQLVTYGPYHWVRHPLYSMGLLLCISLTLLTALWPFAIGMLIPLAVLFWRIPLEEQRLIEQFGDEYRAYMQRTGRFLPKF